MPSWVVLIIDLLLTFFVAFLSFILYNLMGVSFYDSWSVTDRFLLVLAVYGFYYLVFRTYKSVIRFSGMNDLFRLFYAVLASLATLVAINLLYYSYYTTFIYVSYTLIFSAINIFSALVFFRIFIKFLFRYFSNEINDAENIAIIGVDGNTIAFAEGIVSNPAYYKLQFFIDTNKKLEGKKIIGIPVYTKLHKIGTLLRYFKVNNIVLVKNYLPKKQEEALIDDCLKNNITIFYPKLYEGNNEQFDLKKSLKKYTIEELLFRDTISIDNQSIHAFLTNQTVMITGGAGSIGSEIINQVAHFYPKKIVVLDQAETPLNDLELKITQAHPKITVCYELCDITNQNEVAKIFQEHQPQIIYHAAAYKHVPVLEKNFAQAIKVNIFGTQKLIDLAIKHQVKSFVFVSTDKAVNPTNIMGASKRIAEIVVQSRVKLNPAETKTKVIVTRFGNVLGSNGSVVHLFEKQIAAGGPLTVTHPDINRFFMTIPEACKLVLEAGAMGKGGEIFVFDMGDPIKIKDLAEKMIRLSGKLPHKDIAIQYTGLRPGEKLYEELLADTSKTLPTYHQKILIAQDPEPCLTTVEDFLTRLDNTTFDSKEAVIEFFKELVPEFMTTLK